MPALRRYYRGHSLVAMRDEVAGQNRYYHFDHQGTTQCLTDSTGAVTDRFAADAWGVQVKRTGTSINRHWYIGRLGYYRHPDQQSEYVRARHLAVPRARWLSRDPLAQLILYGYGLNGPTIEADPTGLWERDPPDGTSAPPPPPPPPRKCYLLAILGHGGVPGVRNEVVQTTYDWWRTTIKGPGIIQRSDIVRAFPNWNSKTPAAAIYRIMEQQIPRNPCWCIVAYSRGGGQAYRLTGKLWTKHADYVQKYPLKIVVTVDPVDIYWKPGEEGHVRDLTHDCVPGRIGTDPPTRHVNYRAEFESSILGIGDTGKCEPAGTISDVVTGTTHIEVHETTNAAVVRYGLLDRIKAELTGFCKP